MPVTSFSTLSTDAPNVWIARQTYRLVERNLRLGKYATKYQLPQRMGTTLRIVRHGRIALPTIPLTEGTAPTAVALSIANVDVTIQQWGIVVELTDLALITLNHPALQVAISRTAMAMSETLEREMAVVLQAGTNVRFPGSVTARTGLAVTDVLTTSVVLEATAALRTRGAAEQEGGLFGGVMAPAQEADILGSDSTFQSASNFANVKALQFGEIGIWMGVRWARGNFLPILRGETAVSALGNVDVTNPSAVDHVKEGGTENAVYTANAAIPIVVVARDINSNIERKVSQSDNVVIGGGNTAVRVRTPNSVNYVYDIYAGDSVTGGTARLSGSRIAADTIFLIPSLPTGAAVAPVIPADDVEVFTAWVFGLDAFGRVELNGMSLQSFLTPAGASFSNPLAQARRIGSKIAWRSFIIENDFFERLETGSAFSASLPA